MKKNGHVLNSCRITSMCRSFNAKDLSQVVYALAKLGRLPPATSSVLDSEGPPKLMHSPPPVTMVSPPSARVPVQEASPLSPSLVLNPFSYPSQHLGPAANTSAGTPMVSWQGSQNADAGGGRHAWCQALLREAAATFPRCSGQDLANLG